ncbi:CopG family transcriptional regulator [Iningainema tapete]|uniref:CopG family transcriptional regulator n=1 Tax=Iningainema tapete BLCC-T55 TaxID=2748662 RepID=A0A8J6XQ83_9CYAN|nr:CopG family transcriptional regulator [Iningainema tapete]MBD2775371.1 CopG family transcriptional regulator [Iningainema tapete BLCC-T55]
MSSYPLQLPEELMQEVRRLAQMNQVPPEQWLIAAIKRHVAAEQSLSHLWLAAKSADYDRFDQILARVPDVNPMPGDEL